MSKSLGRWVGGCMITKCQFYTKVSDQVEDNCSFS